VASFTANVCEKKAAPMVDSYNINIYQSQEAHTECENNNININRRAINLEFNKLIFDKP